MCELMHHPLEQVLKLKNIQLIDLQVVAVCPKYTYVYEILNTKSLCCYIHTYIHRDT